jgi:hypothetical protein
VVRLQVVATTNKGGGAALPAPSWEMDRTTSARVPGGTLSVRIASTFVPDNAAQP